MFRRLLCSSLVKHLPSTSVSVAVSSSVLRSPSIGSVKNPLRFCSTVEVTLLKGDWMCPTCKEHNFARRSTCYGCQKPRDKFEENQPGNRSDRNRVLAKRDWTCAACGLSNFAHRRECFHCCIPRSVLDVESTEDTGSNKDDVTSSSSVRPASSRRRSLARDRLLQGDWMCPQCKAHNFASRQECFGCALTKPKDLPTAELHMQEGDWMCPTCDAHNFAKREICFKCSATKGTNDVKEDTETKED